MYSCFLINYIHSIPTELFQFVVDFKISTKKKDKLFTRPALYIVYLSNNQMWANSIECDRIVSMVNTANVNEIKY